MASWPIVCIVCGDGEEPWPRQLTIVALVGRGRDLYWASSCMGFPPQGLHRTINSKKKQATSQGVLEIFCQFPLESVSGGVGGEDQRIKATDLVCCLSGDQSAMETYG